MLIFASNTCSRSGLFFYDLTTGEFLGSKYLTFSHPYEVAGATATADGGIAVTGTPAGDFRRICLIKTSEKKLASLF